ncbi:MAG: GNAT family N-acetyltransferase [Deltaproteobacteria bacterium]|nr:GNAT family N-acetyltransferase [Deltaproteobacteria bacterium]
MSEQIKTQTESLEAQMLNALELFHYAHRFRDNLFVFYYDPDVDFAQTITDLRVLESTNIKVAILVRDSQLLREEINSWNLRGSNYLLLPLSFSGQDWPADKIALGALSSTQTPIFAYDYAEESPTPRSAMDKYAFDIADKLNAHKLFFVTEVSGLQVHHIFYSHPSPEQIRRFLKEGKGINIGAERLNLIYDQRQNKQFEVVLLRTEAGAIFEEIFTHRGRGTLFSDKYPNIVRRATPSDTKDISLLIKAHVADKLILPISEEDIFKQIHLFHVYTVNEAIVATARLTEYGNVAELAKFCTLPRYQRQGRAHELAMALINKAREMGKDYVFALSIVPQMWKFFHDLGFIEVDRQTLPEEWTRNYDFARPSKGFICRLSNK